jgi:hypothetical protein
LPPVTCIIAADAGSQRQGGHRHRAAAARPLTAEVGSVLARVQGAVRPQDVIRVATLSVTPQPTLDVSGAASDSRIRQGAAPGQ